MAAMKFQTQPNPESLETELSLSFGVQAKTKNTIDDSFASEHNKVEKVQVGETKSEQVLEEVPTELTLGYNSCNAKKRKTSGYSVENSLEVAEEERLSDLFTQKKKLGFDPWVIKKRITKSDTGHQARLILPAQLVKTHIFPFWDAERVGNIHNGILVAVWDCDTNSEHQLVFKHWTSGGYVLVGKWYSGFVKRKGLKESDEIGLYWNQSTSRFNFKVLNMAAGNN